MVYLWIVSLLWSASFGLIATYLQGIPPAWLAWVRLSLALIVLAPFLRVRGLSGRDYGMLMGIGAVQYGLMYVLYFAAFPHLPGRSYLLALFTVTTPMYVGLFHQAWRGIWQHALWWPLLLALVGAAVIRWPWDRAWEWHAGFWIAFFLMQGSNAAFALGQIGYREVKARLSHHRDHEIYGLVFAGGVLATLVPVAWDGVWLPGRTLTPSAVVVLILLGVVSSGLGFYWWNKGATLVSANTLAVMNNLKIPLAVAVSLVVFRELTQIRLLPFVGGSIVLAAALFLSQRWDRKV